MKNKILVVLKNVTVLLGIAITVVAFLTGCAKKDNESKTYNKENEVIGKNVTNGNSQNQNNSNIVSTNDMILKDKSKPVVYSHISKSETKYNEAPNGNKYAVSYKYKIPQINIDSAAAETINKSILNDYEETYKQYEKDGDSGCSCIDYSYAINGEILSVEIYANWDGGSTQRSAYNINVKNGNEVSHPSILEQKGIIESEFASKLSSMVTELLKSMYTPSSELSDPNAIEIYNAQYRKTTDISNCSVGNDMYLNSNNELCVILKRYNLAGPDSTEIIVNFDKRAIEND